MFDGKNLPTKQVAMGSVSCFTSERYQSRCSRQKPTGAQMKRHTVTPSRSLRMPLAKEANTASDLDSPQFSSYKDSIARRLLAFDSKHASSGDSPSELDDFVTYLAQETWASLPEAFWTASHETAQSSTLLTSPDDLDAENLPLESTPPAFSDSLTAYGYATDRESALDFLRLAIRDYLKDVCAAPPPWSSTRTQLCELCERDLPLTYHHLIPRSVHAKVLKKKWHPENMLNSVAWLCR